jgi:tRNA (mo5U34)-methyltransferase
VASQQQDLHDQIVRLGPWHFDIEVADGLTTGVSRDVEYPAEFGPVALHDARPQFHRKLQTLYPAGLDGISVLDCACNCGAHLFWAKELGAGRCFGSDVREHWIRQGRFLQEHRDGTAEDVQLEVHDLYELPQLGLEPFDLTIFTGVFYHLPDPVTGLKAIADLTRDVMIFETATRSNHPDGYLAVEEETTEEVMSGVYGLNWLPTGPEVLARILKWAGFPELRMVRWVKEAEAFPGRGRIGFIAAREPGRLEDTPWERVEV